MVGKYIQKYPEFGIIPHPQKINKQPTNQTLELLISISTVNIVFIDAK